MLSCKVSPMHIDAFPSRYSPQRRSPAKKKKLLASFPSLLPSPFFYRRGEKPTAAEGSLHVRRRVKKTNERNEELLSKTWTMYASKTKRVKTVTTLKQCVLLATARLCDSPFHYSSPPSLLEEQSFFRSVFNNLAPYSICHFVFCTRNLLPPSTETFKACRRMLVWVSFSLCTLSFDLLASKLWDMSK